MVFTEDFYRDEGDRGDKKNKNVFSSIPSIPFIPVHFLLCEPEKKGFPCQA
jgi:hypothetical protein